MVGRRSQGKDVGRGISEGVQVVRNSASRHHDLSLTLNGFARGGALHDFSFEDNLSGVLALTV